MSALDTPITVTFFGNTAAGKKLERPETLRSIARHAATVSAPSKAELPWIKLAIFGEDRTAKGSLRHAANMVSITGVEGDYDLGALTPADAAAMLKAANIAALFYTSPSHRTIDKNGKYLGERWRVLCPLSKPAPVSERSKLLARVNGVLGGVLSNESFVNAQSYYIGGVGVRAPETTLVNGRYIDEAADLDETAIGKPGGEVSLTRVPLPGGLEPDATATVALERACALFNDADLVRDNGRHHTMLAATLAVAPFVLSGHLEYQDTHDAIQTAMETGADPREIAFPTEITDALDRALTMVSEYIPPTDPEDDFGGVLLDAPPVGTPEAEQVKAQTRGAPLVLYRATPTSNATKILDTHYRSDDGLLLRYYQSEFYRWVGTHYEITPEDEMRAAVRGILADAITVKTVKNEDGEAEEIEVPFEPTNKDVQETAAALRDAVILPASRGAPAWVGKPAMPPAEILPCANGLLHMPTRELSPLTPQFFNVNAVPYAYDVSASAPAEWLRFLASLWPDDQESIDTLQELFGLLLTQDTRYQKIWLIVGPPRSGKGTINRVLIEMLGKANTCSPTLGQLGQQFGLASLIGKPLAVISDADLGHRSDAAAVTECLKAVSGEDQRTVQRKNLVDWTGTLPTRFVIMANKLPNLGDDSSALASRLVVLQMTKSFLGQEDQSLTDRLLGELPGVLLWALDGLARLNSRRYFIQPQTGRAAISDMADMSSPISVFLRDRCVLGGWQSVECSELFMAWRVWCVGQNRENQAGAAQKFGVMLRSAVPSVYVSQPRRNGKNSRVYVGVGLAAPSMEDTGLEDLLK